jgi:glycosyltransferase involved in cell wall biosynthesis
MRVLTLIDGLRMGGAETLLAPLVSTARELDIEMDVVSLSGASVSSAKTIALLESAGIRPRFLGIRRLLDPSALVRITSEVRRSRCDIVHAHLEMAATLAVPAAALTGRRAVCTFHHVARPLTGRAAKRERLAVEVASRGHRVLFVSEASRESFRRRYRPRGLPANWSVVHNGVDLAEYVAGEPDRAARAELSGGRGPLVVLPAAFRDFKGIPVAIEAWPAVLERCPGAVLALVGGGDMEPQLRRRVAELNLTAAVVFAGVRADMPRVYRAADLVLLPSTHGENLPTVLMEAAAAGRAVAASRAGGIPDIVRDGATGLLFEPGNTPALAATVLTLLLDTGLRERLAEAAAGWAHQRFSARAWVRTLLDIYRDATHAGQQEPGCPS